MDVSYLLLDIITYNQVYYTGNTPLPIILLYICKSLILKGNTVIYKANFNIYKDVLLYITV